MAAPSGAGAAPEHPGAFANALPRPPGELEELQQAWKPPSGLRLVTAVNNTYVGVFYVGTAFLFFLLAGVLALLMRTQLAVPENDLLRPDTYNQFFTMHGTVMMFLFAVPMVEAVGVLLLPNMLGARDLPFPRLSAYAFWAYAIGGLVFFCSLFWGLAPRGGWFMYPPLTSYQYAPGDNADFWLLGIGFIEISAIAGAIEIVVGVLRTRAPGMTLARMPIYAWSMLVLAGLIIFAFPAVILATLLLEVERTFQWPFFIAAKGGDPLLWQHLFWFFGHPEVYIIFLPAAGMVSMIVPAMAGRPLVGYRLVVLALVGTGFLSFGLWVHHMFATGIPQISLSFFSAASMAVAVPSGIQVFAWIATVAAARRMRPLKTPMLFVLGFFFVFVLGGLTGVMVAVVPFDWQAHDTYFIVAHLHYVLIGGMVFPLFAALYYWIPAVSRRALSERLGRWAFWLMFTGVNLTFFPMHLTGMMGMPRRVYTYADYPGWGLLNLLSTGGAYLIAAGVLLVVVDVARNFRLSFEGNAGNVWNAGTLEWLPNGTYGTRSIPRITGREPLWDQPGLAQTVEEGRWYLPRTATGRRETIVTSAIDAEPQYVLLMPGPGWSPVLAAAGTAGFFLLLTVKLVWPAVLFGVVGVAAMLRWLWSSDPDPGHPPVDIGGGVHLPVQMTGPSSHSWWAMVVLVLVSGSIFASLAFSYLFLWTVSPDVWPAQREALPGLGWPAASAALLVASALLVGWCSRRLARSGVRGQRLLQLALGLAVLLLGASCVVEFQAHLSSPLRPTHSGYGAVVYMVGALQAFFVVVVAFMGLYTVARSACGLLSARRRQTFDNTRLFWYYTVAQGLAGLALVHGFPRLAA